MGHETLWITEEFRKTASPRHRAPGAGVKPTRGGPPGAGSRGLGLSLATGLEEGGDAALGAKPVPGAPPQLTAEQHQQLLSLLLQGAKANGFPNELWTLKRIAAVIQVHYGVRYHPSHVWKLLRRLGWSCQVPEGRAIQRDEAAIARWRRYQWPALKKSPTTRRPPRLPG